MLKAKTMSKSFSPEFVDPFLGKGSLRGIKRKENQRHPIFIQKLQGAGDTLDSEKSSLYTSHLKKKPSRQQLPNTRKNNKIFIHSSQQKKEPCHENQGILVCFNTPPGCPLGALQKDLYFF